MGHKAPKMDLRCTACRADKCEDCTDLSRVACGFDPDCPCTRKHHAAKVSEARREELDNEDDYVDYGDYDIELESL